MKSSMIPTEVRAPVHVVEIRSLIVFGTDPIDPRFHSPLKSSMLPSVVAPPPTALPPPIEVTPFTPQSVPNAPSPQEDSEEDAEQARRRTIAERMAKLGGIRFGAPPAPALAPWWFHAHLLVWQFHCVAIFRFRFEALQTHRDEEVLL